VAHVVPAHLDFRFVAEWLVKNFIQRGDMITLTAPTGGVTSGQGVLVGNLFGIAATTAAEGESIEIAPVGVYELPKRASAVIAAGDRVAWDNTAKQGCRLGSQRSRREMA
jgi:predicted RecA/RadA family phage recombinase